MARVIFVSALLSMMSQAAAGELRYQAFHIPSESMAPTLQTGDQIMAHMRSPGELRRGDILLVRAPRDSTYIVRLVGLPGDQVAVIKGVVSINGKPVTLQSAGTETVKDSLGTRTVRRFKEQFPGEAGSHHIYDDGQTLGDQFGPVRVRAGHVFLLGDNRDHSADSRFSHHEYGLEQVPVADILGWPLFHSFGSRRPMGERISREDMK